jgi:Arc/MetJ-type ribon-helix-helix transcriptional regulator
MSKMITVRMSEDRVRAIDELVASGSHKTRAAVIVEAIDRLVAELERERIDREIVEGYTRIPETDEEIEWAESSTLESIREEPW